MDSLYEDFLNHYLDIIITGMLDHKNSSCFKQFIEKFQNRKFHSVEDYLEIKLPRRIYFMASCDDEDDFVIDKSDEWSVIGYDMNKKFGIVFIKTATHVKFLIKSKVVVKIHTKTRIF